MLDREGMPPSDAAIGLLRREDFAARRGTLLLWRNDAAGRRAALREGGGGVLPGLIRRGRLSPYILKTMDELEAAGLAEFVEDLELAVPRH